MFIKIINIISYTFYLIAPVIDGLVQQCQLKIIISFLIKKFFVVLHLDLKISNNLCVK